jgi:hypothetical protein
MFCPIRTKNGEAGISDGDAALNSSAGVLVSLTAGAAAAASGERYRPPRIETLSRTRSSSARRLACAGLGPPVSR